METNLVGMIWVVTFGKQLIKMFDVKKLTTTPKDQWEAIDALVKKEQELIAALHIMQAIIDHPEEEFMDIHKDRITKFVQQYIKQ